MASTSETGHAKNLSAFADLILFCEGYGPAYQPANAALSITNMQALLDSARQAMSHCVAMGIAYDGSVNARMPAYKQLRPLCTQLVNALAASGARTEAVKDAQTINRKLQGKRAGKLPAGEPADPTQPAPNTHSVSQQSHVQLAEHFAKLIDLLAAEPLYQPHEKHLKTDALLVRLQELRDADREVARAYTTWSNSRLQRDAALYQDDTGIVPVAQDVKKYIKSVFGATAPQYKQVQGLQFSRVRV